MHIFVTGGTGFIGKALCAELCRRGEQVTVLSRRPDTVAQRIGLPVEAPASPDYLRDHAVDVVINLAGVPIADLRWSSATNFLKSSSRRKSRRRGAGKHFPPNKKKVKKIHLIRATLRRGKKTSTCLSFPCVVKKPI